MPYFRERVFSGFREFLASFFFLARLFLEMLSYLENFPGARISDGAEGLEDSEERDAVDSDSSTNAFFFRLGLTEISISREKSFLARKFVILVVLQNARFFKTYVPFRDFFIKIHSYMIKGHLALLRRPLVACKQDASARTHVFWS